MSSLPTTLYLYEKTISPSYYYKLFRRSCSQGAAIVKHAITVIDKLSLPQRPLRTNSIIYNVILVGRMNSIMSNVPRVGRTNSIMSNVTGVLIKLTAYRYEVCTVAVWQANIRVYSSVMVAVWQATTRYPP